MPTETPSQGLKQCRKCKTPKPVDDFYMKAPDRNGHRYRASWCKGCTIQRNNAHAARMRKLDPIGSNAYFRKRYQRIKDEVFAHYGGYVCACCGETERLFMTLDHVDNDGGEFRKKTFGSQQFSGYRTYEWLWLHNYPEDCKLQVLCANCQHGKRMNHGVCPHQARCNDHSLEEVGPSGPKRIAPATGEDMVSPAAKAAAA